jgi:hypothetical protein
MTSFALHRTVHVFTEGVMHHYVEFHIFQISIIEPLLFLIFITFRPLSTPHNVFHVFLHFGLFYYYQS